MPSLGSNPCSLQLEKGFVQQQRPRAAKNKLSKSLLRGGSPIAATWNSDCQEEGVKARGGTGNKREPRQRPGCTLGPGHCRVQQTVTSVDEGGKRRISETPRPLARFLGGLSKLGSLVEE